MNTDEEKFFSELCVMKKELKESLNIHSGSQKIKHLIIEELLDVELSMDKLTNGEYGICENCGEPMPLGVLEMIPTLKSMKDIEQVEGFYRKQIYT
ncbi:hypothetical protein [Bacillus sp. 03113]|uniref:hypothetical protein n=1 Tax=Bacillus sp. 03113 TaxID=2578211 RepID=UPI0011432BCC|nr:hypothetical protein [Bacillus sp. 03113]